MTFRPSSGSGIADPDDIEQRLHVFDDLTTGRISIDTICAIEDPSASILCFLSKLSRRSGQPELSQKPLKGSATPIFSRCSTAGPLAPILSYCNRILIAFLFQKTFAIQLSFHQRFFVKLLRTEWEI
jgi:hypothetical protein